MVVVGGCVGGIATIGLRHAGDTPWWGVYGSKTPRWCGWCRGGVCECCGGEVVYGRGAGCAGCCVVARAQGWGLWVGAWGELRP